MQIFRFGLVLLLAVAPLAGCDGGSISGTYQNVADKAEYLQLGKGNTFYLKADGKELNGIYAVEKNKLMLDAGRSIRAMGTIEGDVIIDSEGLSWQKVR